MKLEKIIEFDKDEIAIVQSINEEERKILFYQYSILPHKGQKHYKLNLDTKQVSELDSSDYKEQVIWLTSLTVMPKLKSEVIVKENHLYTTALNLENAIEHFRKMIFERKTPNRVITNKEKL